MNSENKNAATLTSGASYIELVEGLLAVGNAHFRRTWRVGTDGVLSAESFADTATGTQWLIDAPGQVSMTPAVPLPDETRALSLAEVPAPSLIEAPSLTAELTATGSGATLTYFFQVFPNVRGVRMRLHATVTGAADETATSGITATGDEPTGIEQDAPLVTATPDGGRDTLESLTLAPLHLRLTQVTLQDQTDHHNELVAEQEWLLHPSERTLLLPGCLFVVEDVLTGGGLVFLKEAPLPAERPVSSPHDLQAEAQKKRFLFSGHGAGADGQGYPFITLAYHGGAAGRVAALQQYQRCLRPYVPSRDGMFVSNTWGDRNRDARITGEFMAGEITAGARLGVDVIQIDDGWQVGATSNSVRAATQGGVWEGFHAVRGDFWAVDAARFPDGIVPLVAAARAEGIRFGLWFGPDSADDFALWERDAETILRLYRDWGIEYIKIDGVKVRTKQGERNLHAFFDAVLTGSAGRVVFDLDVTAEVRPGYFGMVRVGPLFVENRYTDWHKYWPHYTLRNLWKLAHYVDPLRLRLEWLNNDRHRDLYENDPLAPSTLRPDYLFATVMFASPLGWFEMASLPQAYFDEAAPLIATWKKHREAIFGGTILPVGSAPDGVSWTGFVSVGADGGAYLLIFREASASAHYETAFPLLPETGETREAVLLGGDGSATVTGGRLAAHIPEAGRFLFAHLPASL